MKPSYKRISSLTKLRLKKSPDANNLSVYSKSILRPSLETKKSLHNKIKHKNSIALPETSAKPQRKLNIPFSLVLSSSPNKAESTARTYFYKMQAILNEPKTDNSQSGEYNAFLKLFHEISALVKPFDEILRQLLEKIENYWIHINDSENLVKELRQYEKNHKKLTEEIGKRAKEKENLVNKLNKCSSLIAELTSENRLLTGKLENLSKKTGKKADVSVDSEKLINSMFEQYETLQLQKAELHEFILQEKKHTRIIELLRFQVENIDDTIGQVNKEFENMHS